MLKMEGSGLLVMNVNLAVTVNLTIAVQAKILHQTLLTVGAGLEF